MAITRSMLDLALEEAGKSKAVKIKKINLVLGTLSGVVGDCVQFYFGLMSKDTIAEGAELSCEIVPTRARCRQCGKVFEVNDLCWACPECNSIGGEVVTGNELFIKSIEVE